MLLKFVPNGQKTSTDLDNGLAPDGRQAIIWTNAGRIPWRIYAHYMGRWVKFSFYIIPQQRKRFFKLIVAK